MPKPDKEARLKVQLNKEQAEGLFYLSLVMAGLFAFLFLGSGEPVLFDDSGAYLRVERVEGVMPVYPLFLLINQYLFGDESYLQIVIVEQAVLSVICVTSWIKTIKEKFALKYWEAYLAFGLSLIPFTTDMPLAMSTQEILTEGIAYGLFYLFMSMVLKAVWTRKYEYLVGTYGTVLLLAMVRSQLQILFGVCGIVFLYITLVRGGRRNKAAVWGRVLSGLAGCLIISLLGVLMISRITVGYKDMIRNHEGFSVFVMRVQSPESYQSYLEEKLAEQAKQEENAETEAAGEIVSDSAEAQEDAGKDGKTETEEEKLLRKGFSPSQYVSLIFSRGMYEADLEDAELFEDEVVRGLFLELYEAADAAGERYPYAQKGLWMWKDIVGGIGKVGKTCLSVPSEYYVANYPDIIRSDDFSDIRNAHLQTIGMTLLKEHFGRFLYHTLMLLPQAFICTIFFQIAPIYLLCHLATLFLYVSALALMAWGYADKRVDNKYAEFMALVLGTNVVMVLIISLVFFGQQRYLVYNFGIFYIAYGLLVQQLWKCRLRDWVLTKRGKQGL